jgi:hypothetical protein
VLNPSIFNVERLLLDLELEATSLPEEAGTWFVEAFKGRKLKPPVQFVISDQSLAEYLNRISGSYFEKGNGSPATLEEAYSLARIHFEAEFGKDSWGPLVRLIVRGGDCYAERGTIEADEQLLPADEIYWSAKRPPG